MAYVQGHEGSLSTLTAGSGGTIPQKTACFRWGFDDERAPVDMTPFNATRRVVEVGLPFGSGFFDVFLDDTAPATVAPLADGVTATAIFTADTLNIYTGTIKIGGASLHGATSVEAGTRKFMRYKFYWITLSASAS